MAIIGGSEVAAVPREEGDVIFSKRLVCALAVALAFQLAVSAHAVVYVDASAGGANDGSSWADAYTDLQVALAATASGEIWVAAGTYTPAGPGGDRNATFALGSGVAVYGGFAGIEVQRAQRDPNANPTILSGDLNGDDTPRAVNGHAGWLNPIENSHHVVTADGADATAILDGVTVGHGYAYRSGFTGPPIGAGGGLLITNGSATVRHTTITTNGGLFGGGVAVLGGSPRFQDVAFEGNYADIGSGGAVYNDGTSASTFEDCLFRANAAIGAGVSGGGSGGAIYNVGNGELTVRRSVFVRNFTGFRTYSYSDTRTQGGAIANWGNVATILDSRFFGNRSHLGGAVYGYDLEIVNGLFSGNEAHDIRATGLSPAGLGGAMVAFGNTNVTNTTVSANESTDNGAGLYTAGNVTVANSIVWGNMVNKFIEPGEDPIPLVKMQIHSGGGVLDILFSDVEGLFETIPGEDPPDPANFPGSLDIDPQFVGPLGPDGQVGTEDDDLRLATGSAAIDAGDNASVPLGTGKDLDGNRRFFDDPATPDSGAGAAPLVDLGAYEFGSSPPAALSCGLGAEIPFLLAGVIALRRRLRGRTG
jgi:hypothetical protein